MNKILDIIAVVILVAVGCFAIIEANRRSERFIYHFEQKYGYVPDSQTRFWWGVNHRYESRKMANTPIPEQLEVR